MSTENSMSLMSEQAELTMSSLDLLEMVNEARKEAGESAIRRNDFHARVKDELDGENYEIFVVRNFNNTETEAFRLDRDQCVLVSMRESKSVRRKVLARLKEMESGHSFRIPQSLPEALRLAAEQAEQLERQQALIEQQRPAVEFAKQIASSDKGVKLGNYAKAVGIGPRRIFDLLREMRVLMTGGDRHNLPYQEFIERGYFNVRQTSYEANEERRIGHTPLITGKGEQWLTRRLLDAGMLKAVPTKGPGA